MHALIAEFQAVLQRQLLVSFKVLYRIFAAAHKNGLIGNWWEIVQSEANYF